MKKKIFAIVLAGLMAASMLAGCGEDTSTASTASSTSSVASAADNTSVAEGEMVSDETFAALQDNYALMVEAYDAVAELYSQDEIAADAEIEDVMNQAADLINEMGEITQDTLTEEDAVTLSDAMVDILDALSLLVDSMEVVDEESAAEGEAVEGEIVSDETFAALQENYALLVELYDAVVELYADDSVEADADIEAALTESADVIAQMGEITQDTITEDDAVVLNDTMVTLAETLSAVVDAM